MFKKNISLLIGCLLSAAIYLPGCRNEPAGKKVDYERQIPGVNDSISVEVAERGKVLISYSDCHTCHKTNEKSVGPAFTDIAKRYPVNKVYINMLAQKVIVGGSGSWGTPVMAPHPKLPLEDAKAMATYIMSMKK